MNPLTFVAAFALALLLLGGASCHVDVRSTPSNSRTCIERSRYPLMDKKYRCTEAEFAAQQTQLPLH